MKQLTFIPDINLEQHENILAEQRLSTKDIEKDPVDYDLIRKLSEQDQYQEKKPIGIEAGMAYIAIPASLMIWIGIAYLVSVIFLKFDYFI